MKRVAEIILDGAGRYADRTAVADPNESVTYAELAVQASRLGRAVRGLGIEPGERSLVALPNSVDFVRAHFANLLAGFVSVPCDAAITASTLHVLCRSCQPKLLLTDASTFARLVIELPLPGCLERVVLLGASNDAVTTDGRVYHALQLSAQQAHGFLDVPRGEDELAALMYTTGTTGEAKGVQLTNRNILAALRSITEFVGYGPDDREVVILPLSHNFGLGHLYCNLMSGGAVYTEPGLARTGRVLKAVESFKATGFPGTPLGFGMLIDKFGPVLAQKAKNVRFSVIDSAPLPPERTEQLRGLLPQLDVMVYYGLTEASRSAFISLTKMGPAYYRSVGRPMKHVEVQVRPAEGVTAVSTATGEIVIRGPAVTSGYWNDPAATNAAIRGGWLHTGDLGHIDEQGLLWVTGRLKDVINVGGYKVNPSEVEKILLSWPGVVDVGVVGVQVDPTLTSEAVVGALVVNADFKLDETALQQHCLAKLEKFKVPTAFVVVAEIPRTNTGKVKRIDLGKVVVAQLGKNGGAVL